MYVNSLILYLGPILLEYVLQPGHDQAIHALSGSSLEDHLNVPVT